MREQLRDIKIAIIGAEKSKAELDSPQITWNEDASKLDAGGFDFAIYMGLEDALSITFEEEKSIIHTSHEGRASLLQSVIDILTSEQYMDLDHADVMDTWGDECKFESINAEPNDAQSRAAEWLRDKNGEIRDALLIYFQGEFSQSLVIEITEKIASMLMPGAELACAFSYNEENNAKMSLWYR